MPTLQTLSTPTGSFRCWNLSRRVSSAGSDLIDAQLVQYLLVRWANDRSVDSSQSEAGSFYKIGDVDGIWGPRSARALSLFQASTVTHDPSISLSPSIIIEDDAVDPMPPGTTVVGHSTKLFKIFVLQEAYFTAINGGSLEFSDDKTIDRTFMGMSVDGQCPHQLALALIAINLPPVVETPDDGS